MLSTTRALPAIAALAAILLLLPAVALASARRQRSKASSYVPSKVVVGYATGSKRGAVVIARAAGATGAGEAVSDEPEAAEAAIEAPLLARSAGLAASRIGPVRSTRTARQTRVLTLKRGVSVKAAIKRLRRRGDVAWAVPDYVAHASAVEAPGEAPVEAVEQASEEEGESPGTTPPPTEYIPDDPGNRGAAGEWRALQWNFVGPFGVKAPEAWQNLIADGRPGGEGVTVAVLDTGIAYATRGKFLRSPDFSAGQFVKGYDFVRRDPFAYDRNGHGTFVAGTIAEATNNGKDLTGLAYGVRLMPVRVLNATGEGDASTIAKGIRFAVRHGAEVINLSLEFSGGVTAADVPELVSSLAYAHRHGVVVVAAAGNEDSTNIPEPARDKYVIAVGASTQHGCLAEYSNYGRGIALVAPGGGADANLPGDPNCHPRATAGKDVFQETFKGTSPRVFGMPGGYEGTSMAAPHVAATAALVIASGVLGSDPTPSAVRKRLLQTATPLGGESDRVDYGHGLLNAGAATARSGEEDEAAHLRCQASRRDGPVT